MPYQIQTEDGIVIEDIPDHIKPDAFILKAKVQNARQARLAGRGASAAELSQPGINPTEGMSGTDKFLSGAGKALTDAGRGIEQFAGMVPQSDVDQSKAQDAPLMNTGAGMAGNIAGNIALTAPFSAGSIPGAAALGGALGAAQPVASDESRLQNVALGAAGGGLGQTAANMVGRAIKPVQSSLNGPLQELADKAPGYGINLTTAQKTGSKPLKIMDAVMENMPFTADKQAAIKEAQRQAFTKAALNTVGETADQVTPDVMNAARNRIGGEFNRLSDNNSVKLGDALLDSIGKVEQSITPFSKGIRSTVDDALELAAKGEISGREYQSVRTSLGNAAKGSWTTNPELGQALKTIQGALDDAADKSISAADRDAWNTARAQWSNLKVLEKAAKPTSADAVSGNVSAAKLAHALQTADPKGFTYGTRGGDLPDLARIGQAFVKDQIPDSGSAQRLLYQRLLNSPWEALKGMTGGLSVPMQALMNSERGQKYLAQGLLPGATEKQKLLAEMLRKGAGSTGAALPLGYAQQQ